MNCAASRMRSAGHPSGCRRARTRACSAARVHARPRHILQLREAARVIVMRTPVHQDLHVRGAEPQLLDVREDERRRLRQSAIEEDGAGGRVDEDRRDTLLCLRRTYRRRCGTARAARSSSRRARSSSVETISCDVSGRCGRRHEGGGDRQDATANDRFHGRIFSSASSVRITGRICSHATGAGVDAGRLLRIVRRNDAVVV